MWGGQSTLWSSERVSAWASVSSDSEGFESLANDFRTRSSGLIQQCVGMTTFTQRKSRVSRPRICDESFFIGQDFTKIWQRQGELTGGSPTRMKGDSTPPTPKPCQAQFSS